MCHHRGNVFSQALNSYFIQHYSVRPHSAQPGTPLSSKEPYLPPLSPDKPNLEPQKPIGPQSKDNTVYRIL